MSVAFIRSSGSSSTTKTVDSLCGAVGMFSQQPSMNSVPQKLDS
jgi:hypothetical protein